MYKLLNTSGFEMHSRNQVLNLKFMRDDLMKNGRFENPLIKMQNDIRLKMSGHPLLKMEADIRLQSKENSFLKNQLEPNHIKPP